MTQAEMETELAFLRGQVLHLQEGENKRSKAWKSSLIAVRYSVVGFSVVGIGLLVHSWLTRQNLETAIQLILLNVPLIFLGQALRAGSESIEAKE
jgi:hypothetical protein